MPIFFTQLLRQLLGFASPLLCANQDCVNKAPSRLRVVALRYIFIDSIEAEGLPIWMIRRRPSLGLLSVSS